MRSDMKAIAVLLKTWKNIMADYTNQTRDDLPYWHSERANVSFLAAAVWKNGGVAIEEYWTEREKKGEKPVKGWVDLWGKTEKGLEFSLEAKQLWPSKLDYEKIDAQLARCLEDLKSNSWHAKEMQVSVCFLSLRTQDIRRLSKNWQIEEVNKMSRKYHKKNIVIESYFPPKEIIINRKFTEDGTDCYYPGVIAVARIEK